MADRTDGLHHARARSFGARAGNYAAHRPSYPADGVRWALGAATRQVRRVLDLTAGTGKLTEGLPLGLDVTALEPDDGMRTALATGFPEVDALPGTAGVDPATVVVGRRRGRRAGVPLVRP